MEPQQEQQTDDVQSEGELAEYRFYVSSNGGYPVLTCRGGAEMKEALQNVLTMWPDDEVFVRRVDETVIAHATPIKGKDAWAVNWIESE